MEVNKLGKTCPDAILDLTLDGIALSTEMLVCTGSPLDFATARSSALVRFALTSGCLVKNDDTSGRKLTVSAKTSGSITGNGLVETVVLSSSADSTFRYSTSCSSQTLNSGGTLDTSSFKINLQDPT
jgi:hypothetical protein